MLGHTSDHDVEFVDRPSLRTVYSATDNKDELVVKHIPNSSKTPNLIDDIFDLRDQTKQEG